ncbi:MAG TPA: DNA repair protein RecO [Gemmatimonadaceae bacterium]|nr:DNA repair protein RecO [Gemmatimonadaceae bacterium]
MALVATPAVVLHAFDYLESSRILRLATREAGVLSVLARGARRSRNRFGVLDLFCEGTAQLHTKPGRDLQTLSAFEIARARPELAADIGRFTGAAAIAELMLRFARDDAQPSLYDAMVTALDAIADAPPERSRETTLAGAWRLVALLGFAPSLDRCGSCDADVGTAEAATFSHPAGGTLCPRCARLHPGGRVLPRAARDAVRGWANGAGAPELEDAAAKAHQRLLREFLSEHVTDGKALRAFQVWERGAWAAAAAAGGSG